MIIYEYKLGRRMRVDKVTRMLFLYTKLIKGENVNKTIYCFENDCSPRSFDRDIEDIRLYLGESFNWQELKYDRRNDTYFIEGTGQHELEPMEFMFIERILNDTAVLRKDELDMLMSHLLSNTSNYQALMKFRQSEVDNYESPIHNNALLKMHGDLVTIIHQRKCIKIDYFKQSGEEVQKRIFPCAVKYDLGYLYLIAYRCGESDEYPAYYRLDRIYSFTIDRTQTQDEKNKINHYMRYYANGITQMYGGEYVDIELQCQKQFFPYLHDKFRKVAIVEDCDELITVKISAFEEGFIKWLISQPQDMCMIMKPESTKNKLVEEAQKIIRKYGGAY